MPRETRIYQVDAFSAEPFRGNPAGVCLLEEEATEAWMQAVGAEMNLSETAFVLKRAHGFSIRYFTPAVEVELCGHATLASSHILWQEGLVAGEQRIELKAPGGDLSAEREDDWIRLDFPADSLTPAEIPPGLADILGAKPLGAHSGQLNSWLLELASEQAVRELEPDFTAMGRGSYGGIVVTAKADSGECDFVSRFFGPDYGIDEDPVTGVAHCSLGPYWAERLGRNELVGHQVSRRLGIVRVRVRGERVHLLGQAVTVIRGTLLS